MNRIYLKALLLFGVLASLGTKAGAQTNPLPFPPTGHQFVQDWWYLCDIIEDPKPPNPIFSTDYGIEYQYDALFGAVCGVSGTVTWYAGCVPPSGATLDMAGRLGFYIGADPVTGLGGSSQDNTATNPLGIDDGMGLTYGTYEGVSGNFAIAKTYVGNATGGSVEAQYFGQNTVSLAYWGASDRYFIVESTNNDILIQLRVDVIGDAARCQWTFTNTQATAATLGFWFGQYVYMYPETFPGGPNGTPGVYPADWTVAPGVKPIATDTRFAAVPVSGVDNQGLLEQNLPAYMDYGMDQSDAYGLRIILQASAQIPDQTPCNFIDIGNQGFLLGSINANDGAMPDAMIPDDVIPIAGNAYIQKWFTDQVTTPGTITPTLLLGPVGTITGTTQIVAYYKSTWSTSDYAKPYSVVLDAPPIIATTPGNPNQFQNALTGTGFSVAVDLDDTRGFSTNDQSVPLEDVEIDLDLPPGMYDQNLFNATGQRSDHMVQYLNQVLPQTVAKLAFQVGVDATVFGNQNYTVTIIPNPGPTKVVTGTIIVASQPYLDLTGTANCVTAGWAFTDSTWDYILASSGLQLNVGYQAFGWDAAAQNYIIQSGPQRGFGTFLVTNTNVGNVQLSGNPQQQPDLQTGAPQIILQSGWNLIGNPYNYAIPVGELVGVPESDNQNSYTWDQLSDQGYISGYLGYWDPTIQGYETTASDTDLIQPNTGYWLYVQSNLPVTILYPPVLQSYIPNLPDGRLQSAVKTKASQSSQSAPTWALQLAARSNGVLDSLSSVGQTTTAALAKSLTIYKPPVAPVKNGVSSAISVPKGNGTVLLARALTPASVASQTWNWQVYTQSSGPVTLTWPNVNAIPNNVVVKLIDTQTGVQKLLRDTTSYTFNGEARSSHSFQLVVESAPSVPVIESLTGVSGAAQATLTYVLSVNATTTVTMSQNGQVVATLASNRSDAAGTLRVQWNYKDSANRAVRPGIYTATVSSTPAGSATATKSISVTAPR